MSKVSRSFRKRNYYSGNLKVGGNRCKMPLIRRKYTEDQKQILVNLRKDELILESIYPQPEIFY